MAYESGSYENSMQYQAPLLTQSAAQNLLTQTAFASVITFSIVFFIYKILSSKENGEFTRKTLSKISWMLIFPFMTLFNGIITGHLNETTITQVIFSSLSIIIISFLSYVFKILFNKKTDT